MRPLTDFTVYTARYRNVALLSGRYAPVRITLGTPRFRLGYTLVGEIRDLAPPRALFHIETREEFEPRYREHLDRIGVEAIVAQLAALHQRTGQDLALLCFERVDQGDWCHRLCFSAWWKDRTGIVIEELPEVEPPNGQAAPCPSGTRREWERTESKGGAMRGSLKQRSKGSWTIILDLGSKRDPVSGLMKRKQK